MVYYVNYIDIKNYHRGLELDADGLEDLVNQLIHRRDIATIYEIVELEDAPKKKRKSKSDYEEQIYEDWVRRNRIEEEDVFY